MSLHVDRATSNVSPEEIACWTIAVPTRSSQKRSGSVSVREPEPSDNADLDRISCNASDAAVNIWSSTGFKNDISIGIRGVRSLNEAALAKRHARIISFYLVGKMDIHAWKQRRADSICCIGVVGDIDDVIA